MTAHGGVLIFGKLGDFHDAIHPFPFAGFAHPSLGHGGAREIVAEKDRAAMVEVCALREYKRRCETGEEDLGQGAASK